MFTLDQIVTYVIIHAQAPQSFFFIQYSKSGHCYTLVPRTKRVAARAEKIRHNVKKTE
jgi:hypothetical protein